MASGVERPEVQLVVRAAHAYRRARWLCRLLDCGLTWTEAGGPRLLVVEAGEVRFAPAAVSGEPAPLPPGRARSWDERREIFTIATYDRMRVLTTELRRLVTEGWVAELRFDETSVLSGERLRRALSWV